MGLFQCNCQRRDDNHVKFGMPFNVVRLIMLYGTPFNIKVRRLMFRQLNEVNLLHCLAKVCRFWADFDLSSNSLYNLIELYKEQ